MVLASKKRKQAEPNYTVAIVKALARQAMLQQQQTETQSTIEQAEREVAALQKECVDRERRLTALSNTISSTRATLEQQQTYHNLLGSADLTTIEQTRESLQQAMSEHTTLSAEHVQATATQQLQIASLQQIISTEQARFTELATQIEQIGIARQQLQAEHGRALYAEQTMLVQEAERYAHETGKEYSDAQHRLGQAQVRALEVLSTWPELKRRFQAGHRVNEDATTKLLASFVAICDLLIADGEQAGQAIAGLPSGALNILLEVDLSESLHALRGGNSIPLVVQSNRLASLLEQYRRNLAV